jgi:4-diphosphocytidyl-2-C-methyl-D-erythritol kinase
MFNKNYLKNLNNNLEMIAFRKYPELKKIKSFLLTIPNTIFVNMSGSGSSIVAYFQSKRACSIALKKFKRKFNSIWCNASKTI